MTTASKETMHERRGARAERAILAATAELIAEGGVQALTVERVAARSGVAKTTIYRRWRGKRDLALAVLLDVIESAGEVTADVGDTRRELVAFVNAVITVLDTTLMGRVMQGLVPDLATDPALASAFRERVVARRVADARLVIERGKARGDLRRDVDAELAHELLFGPVYYRLMISGAPLDEHLAERIVEAVWPALASDEPRNLDGARP
jgi:AcrR family transcriptional regulator